MKEILELYSNIIDLESDMIMNPDNYTEEDRNKSYELIKYTEDKLHELGFVIDIDGNLKEL